MQRNSWFLTVLMISSVVILSACSAIIERRDNPSLYAPIHSSDAENIYVEDDAGVLFQVPASSIHDIDHPGNVLFTVGGVLLGLGAMMLADGYGSDGDGRIDDDAKYAGYGYGSVGLAMTLGGLIPYLMSRVSAGNVEWGRENPKPVPVVRSVEN